VPSVNRSAVGWLDPAIDSDNTGDSIISEAIGSEVRTFAGTRTIHRLPTQRPWTSQERRAAADCVLFVVGGTNILTSHPLDYRQWMFGLRDLLLLHRRCVLFGVGWWQYQGPPDAAGRWLMRLTLHPGLPHGARDGYTTTRLEEVGFRAMNVSCPTLWNVETEGRSKHRFRGNVVATVTDYLPEPERDRKMLEVLRHRAERLWIWPQGKSDSRYVESLGFGRHLIGAGLDAFDSLLAEDVEYVGTRLHGAVRAMSRGVASVVVVIDNRAAEIGRDVGLWTIQRRHIDSLPESLDSFEDWSLKLPTQAIETFRRSLATQLKT
jgi:hypothetical protein